VTSTEKSDSKLVAVSPSIIRSEKPVPPVVEEAKAPEAEKPIEPKTKKPGERPLFLVIAIVIKHL